MLEGAFVILKSGSCIMTISRLKLQERKACCIWCDQERKISFGKWFCIDELDVVIFDNC